jgi:hypothetical protein
MNEQIRTLAEQAELYFELNDKLFVRAMSAEECEKAYEKFAELIARTCVVICANQIAGTVGTYASAHNSAVKKCIDGIQAHFGLDTTP